MNMLEILNFMSENNIPTSATLIIPEDSYSCDCSANALEYDAEKNEIRLIVF